jgi:hypothetical protein
MPDTVNADPAQTCITTLIRLSTRILLLTMQEGQVLRLCKPRRKPRPPDAVALEEALWAEHADIIDAGTLFVVPTSCLGLCQGNALRSVNSLVLPCNRPHAAGLRLRRPDCKASAWGDVRCPAGVFCAL